MNCCKPANNAALSGFLNADLPVLTVCAFLLDLLGSDAFCLRWRNPSNQEFLFEEAVLADFVFLLPEKEGPAEDVELDWFGFFLESSRHVHFSPGAKARPQ
jgi:hypothetical protein